MRQSNNLLTSFISDENRDMNIHIEHDDIKRQRIQYNSDQLYPNVNISKHFYFSNIF